MEIEIAVPIIECTQFEQSVVLRMSVELMGWVIYRVGDIPNRSALCLSEERAQVPSYLTVEDSVNMVDHLVSILIQVTF